MNSTMNEPVTINLLQIVGSPFWVAEEDGERVFQQLKAAIESGRSAVLSFEGVEALTTSFLNFAVGKLYECFPVEVLQSRLSVVQIPEREARRLKQVIETAKQFYNDPEFRAERTQNIEDYL